MDFSFYYHMNGMEEMVEILPFIMLYLGVFAVAYLIGLVFQLAQYIFRSLGLYTIARRRGLRRAWLVWIPFGCDWIVGSIVDQYQYLSRGEVSGKRKILLGLRLAVFACGLVLIGMAIAFVIRSSASGGNMLVAPAIGMVLVFLAMAVTSVVLTVFWHICRYHLYQSCDPKNGVAYMVLGLVFPVLDAVFGSYFRQAETEGIRIEADIDLPERMQVDVVELSTVFANALENAIHAVRGLPPEQRVIRCRCIRHPQLMFRVANPCAGSVRFDEDGLPLGEDGAPGIGSRSIAAYCAKHGAYCDYRVEQGWFTLQIVQP